jgi:L-threonylcarbamoyladenylate synthase
LIAALASLPAQERVAVVARAALAPLLGTRPGLRFVAAPDNAQHYARDLYSLLRTLDNAAVQRILIERLPLEPEWAAVNDRLGRAAAAFLAGE